MHQFRVTIHRKGNPEPIEGGTATFEGRDYDSFTEAQALQAILPGGDAPEQLDLSLPGFVRWRNILVPATEFERLEITLVAKGR